MCSSRLLTISLTKYLNCVRVTFSYFNSLSTSFLQFQLFIILFVLCISTLWLGITLHSTVQCFSNLQKMSFHCIFLPLFPFPFLLPRKKEMCMFKCLTSLVCTNGCGCGGRVLFLFFPLFLPGGGVWFCFCVVFLRNAGLFFLFHGKTRRHSEAKPQFLRNPPNTCQEK